MPGIAGIIADPSRGENRDALDVMVKRMVHEQFHNSGKYINERLGLGVGWVCHAGSFSDCLPAWNEKKNICLIFSGENFADQTEIDELKAKGHVFESGNASCLVHLYEELGSRFFDKLDGWFSGVLVDLREQKVVLFNDRYGLGRIYYHENTDGFFFSSEAKSLLSVLPVTRQPDLTSLAEFCSCGCALQNRTLFSGISLLPPASRWTFFRTQFAKKEIYFRKETWENQAALSGSEYYEGMKKTFARILPRYFRGQQKIGMSLTGGLDGRMIMAWARCAPGTLPCYTFGSTYRDNTDVIAALQVAKVCGQPHQVITVDGEFLRRFPAFAEKAVYVSDGAMDVTGSVELYVNKIAREIAPVRLTGNYGSEILRGNVAFKPHPLNEMLYDPEFMRLSQTAAETYQAEVHGHPLSFIAFKQVPWHHRSRLSVEQSQTTLRSPYLDNDLVALAYQTPRHLAMSKVPSLRLIADGNPALGRIPTDRGLLCRPIPVVTKAQHLYEEFTVRAEYAYDNGMPQWLAWIDHLFAPVRLEKLFLGRHKFSHFRVWYRDYLSQYLKNVLLDPATRSRAYLQGTALEEMVQSHISGERNYTSEIHKVLSCELIQRQLIEKRWADIP
jgi:asparagine synthase (glutamine-hydrolysing)